MCLQRAFDLWCVRRDFAVEIAGSTGSDLQPFADRRDRDRAGDATSNAEKDGRKTRNLTARRLGIGADRLNFRRDFAGGFRDGFRTRFRRLAVFADAAQLLARVARPDAPFLHPLGMLFGALPLDALADPF
jgi:hypothetical protein